MRKAWRTHARNWPEEVGICAAATRGKALHASLLQARDAGYPYTSIIEFKAVRAPEYDRWAQEARAEDLGNKCEWYVRDYWIPQNPPKEAPADAT